MQSKACEKCGIEKPLHDFYRHYATHDHRWRQCKDCFVAATRARRPVMLAEDGVKTCRLCRESKPTSEFHKGNGRDGLASACKPCAIAEQKAITLRPPPPDKLTPPGTKRCACCGETKPVADFWRNKSRWDGYAHTCKPCMKRIYDLDPQRAIDIVLRSKYRMSRGQYEALYATQDGKCAICGGPQKRKKTGGAKNGEVRKRLAIDHDHDSGSIRGLLCDDCNNGIGFLKTPELLRKAADYLER